MSTEVCLWFEAGGPAQLERARAALAGGRPASAVIAPSAGQSLEPAAVRALVELFQAATVAALVLDDVRLAKAAKADGVHLSWRESLEADYAEARSLLGKNAIVGAEAGHSRHDAMTLGEAGADYIGFAGALPDMPGDEARALQLELVAWWAELMEVPVVALDVTSPAMASALARAGADFVSPTVPAGAAIDDIRSALADIRGAVGEARPAEPAPLAKS